MTIAELHTLDQAVRLTALRAHGRHDYTGRALPLAANDAAYDAPASYFARLRAALARQMREG